MKLRTSEEFIDFSSGEIAWRKKELQLIKSTIDSPKTSASLAEALIRSGIPLIYAHWEGYVKKIGTGYIEFIARRQLAYKDLRYNFIALSMKDLLSTATESNRASVYNSVAHFFMHNITNKSVMMWKDSVDTKSNLSSTVLFDITEALGLDYKAFEAKKYFIDQVMLFRRNNIAHGQYISVDRLEYADMHAQSIEMMEIFRNQVENAVVTKQYLSSKAAE